MNYLKVTKGNISNMVLKNSLILNLKVPHSTISCLAQASWENGSSTREFQSDLSKIQHGLNTKNTCKVIPSQLHISLMKTLKLRREKQVTKAAQEVDGTTSHPASHHFPYCPPL